MYMYSDLVSVNGDAVALFVIILTVGKFSLWTSTLVFIELARLANMCRAVQRNGTSHLEECIGSPEKTGLLPCSFVMIYDNETSKSERTGFIFCNASRNFGF